MAKEYEMAVKIAGEIERSFYKSTKLTKSELRSIAKTASHASDGISSSFKQGMNETSSVFNGIEAVGKKAFKGLVIAATAAGTAVGAAITASVAVGSSFESQMSKVQSICNASTSDLNELKEKAKEMGATTSFSATEAGEAMEYMAMAGWKTSDMINGIDGIMNLAAASGEQLGLTSDIVTDALTAFNLKASDSAHFSDILAAASSNANTNVSMMGETFKYAAPLAGALGYCAEDTALAIGLMANAGIKSGMAGTALRGWLTRMAKPTKESRKAMDDLGIALTDSNGKMLEFADVIHNTKDAFSKLGESEKAQYAAMLAGQNGMSGLLAVVNSCDSDMKKLENSIENCNGATERMAAQRLDNLNGDITILKSGLEGLGIQIYEDLNYPLRVAAQSATSTVANIASNLSSTGKIGEIVGEFEKGLPTAIRETREFTSAFIELANPLINVGNWLLDHPDVIVSTVVGIGTALATYKVASEIMKLGNAIMSLSPAGAVILGVAGAITAVSGIATYIAIANRKMREQNLARHFGNISLSLEELNKVANNIVRTDNLNNIQESLEAMKNVDKIANQIADSVNTLNELNWKVDVGIELSDSEKQKYMDSIQSYIGDVQEIVTQKQYAVNIAVGTLITDEGIENNNVVDKINQFYSGKQAELESLGKKLNKTVTDAFQDGLLDIDEVREITELQSQMAKIQSAVASSKFDSQLELLNLKYAGGELDADSFRNLQDEINKQVDAAVKDYDESLTLSISNAKVMLDDGAIGKAEYDSMVEELKKGYLEQIGDIELKASNFSIDTIKQQYADELSTAMPEFEQAADTAIQYAIDYLNSGMENMALNWDTLQDKIAGFSVMDSSTKAAIQELFNSMVPTIEQLHDLKQKYENAGMEVPKALSNGLNNAAVMGSLASDMKSIWTYVGNQVSNSPEYAIAVQKAQEKGYYIPGVLGQAIEDNKSVVASNIAALHTYIGSEIDAAFRAGYSVNSPVNVIAKPSVSNVPIGPKLPGHATGGIFDKPHIAWFAEDGPEAAIPLDRSKNAIDLWTATGELLGITGNSSSDDFSTLSSNIQSSTESISNSNCEAQINYRPTYIIQGSVSKDEIVSASYESQDNFNQMMQCWIKENGRLNFK